MLGYDVLLSRIRALSIGKSPIIVAIDGRCAAGKTTLSRMLERELSCSVVHMDDFFLQPEQRTPERYAEPGGNVDYERFLREVLLPLKSHVPFSYCPYSCKTGAFGEPIDVLPNNITIAEGAYSCHPTLREYYCLRVFLDVDKSEQRRRILARNGREGLVVFENKWIPLEERYFAAFSVEDGCELTLRL